MGESRLSVKLLAADIPRKMTMPMKMYSLKARPLRTATVTSRANQLVPENIFEYSEF
jgi:hypothetical protein